MIIIAIRAATARERSLGRGLKTMFRDRSLPVAALIAPAPKDKKPVFRAGFLKQHRNCDRRYFALGPLAQTSSDTVGENDSKFFSKRLAKSRAFSS